MILRERTATVEMSTLNPASNNNFLVSKPQTNCSTSTKPKTDFFKYKRSPPLDINKTKFNKSPIHLGFFYFVGTLPPALKEKCY
jgi:hypothetical protein